MALQHHQTLPTVSMPQVQLAVLAPSHHKAPIAAAKATAQHKTALAAAVGCVFLHGC